ncbi:hypothetical protein [Paenibacillus sp. IHBB 10380]|uniref:hypothetical protein n=1 Tax=Paenibacillus sp. IHBB 10380 TaxID=1566358 RepID=UPI0005CFA5E8|nr:hypothetical protein [Paenibacillus sp. IHBB 10380]AJS59225.1 hypothetical protein UB51_12960 [Paenibacillus sp. IHBB 10380]
MSQPNKQAQIKSTLMSKHFYGYVNHALEGSKPQMAEHAKQLQTIIDKSGQDGGSADFEYMRQSGCHKKGVSNVIDYRNIYNCLKDTI